MTERTWHSGPPPHVGWWNASNYRCHDVWRWWNGVVWSTCCFDRNAADVAATHAVNAAWDVLQPGIKWSDYWPENASVPRINPDDDKVTVEFRLPEETAAALNRIAERAGLSVDTVVSIALATQAEAWGLKL